MDITSDYDALSRRRRQQDAAAASSNIQSSDENPDKVADNLNFAREYAQVTGNPAPSPQMVKEFRDVLQQRMDEARNTAMLSTARRAATWYGENPMAVLLAKDDVPNLCSFEQKVQRFWEAPKSNPQTAASVEESIAPVNRPTAPSQPQAPVAPTAQSPARPTAPAAPTSAPAAAGANTNTPRAVPYTQPPVSPTQPVHQPTEPAPRTAQPAAPTTGNAPPSAEPATSAVGDVPLASEEPLSDDEKKKEALIEEIRNAKNAPSENIPILKQKIQNQNWFDTINALDTLQGVLNGTATDDDVRSQLQSRYAHRLTAKEAWERAKSAGQYVLEAPKGAGSASVTESGRIIEGTGQLLSSPKSDQEVALIGEIADGAKLPDDKVPLLEKKLDEQTLLYGPFARYVLNEVRAGRMTSDQAKEQFNGPLDDIAGYLQSWGASLGDYGETLFPAAPGYENSWTRMGGEMFGALLPTMTATVVSGAGAGTGVEMLRAAGDAAAAARKAEKSELEQSDAAVAYSLTAFIDRIPFDKATSPLLKRLYLNSFLQKWIGIGLKEGAAQATQLVAQNYLKKLLVDPTQEVFDKVGDTFIAGGFAGIGKEVVQDFAMIGMNALLRRRGSSHISASHPIAADSTRKAIEDISIAAQASKLRTRSPEDFHGFVAKMAPNPEARDVLVPAGAFVKAAEAAGINPDDLVDSGALALARATDGDVKLSMATYATYFAGSKGDGYIMDNIRPHAGSLTFAESQAFREHANAYGSALNARANPAFSSPIIDLAAERRAYDLAVLRSAIAGRPAETVSHFAISHSAFTSALARSEGRSLNEYLKLHPQP
ncbi:hypothetical protein [Rhizobium mesosinicum]|uniref:Large polyvalent protein associated domain-containing protein n=1 Tax=Rhizobium mesosinicum TaxID=335017 RepID=A0ABS7GYR4_9HYPH|nr:hypothetical protein [Rhizobium mesosinicum]MBW9054871.1 hypothetical protein [Rhizobium mesosinicum]